MITTNRENLKMIIEVGKVAEILSSINEMISKEKFDIQEIDKSIDRIPGDYMLFVDTAKILVCKKIERMLNGLRPLVGSRPIRLVKNSDKQNVKFNDIEKRLVSLKLDPSTTDILIKDAIDFFIGSIMSDIIKTVGQRNSFYPISFMSLPRFGDIGMYDGDILSGNNMFGNNAFPNMFMPTPPVNPTYLGMAPSIEAGKDLTRIYNSFTNSYEYVDNDLTRYLDPVHRITDDDDDDDDDEDDIWERRY